MTDDTLFNFSQSIAGIVRPYSSAITELRNITGKWNPMEKLHAIRKSINKIHEVFTIHWILCSSLNRIRQCTYRGHRGQCPPNEEICIVLHP